MLNKGLTTQTILDGLSQGVLIFNSSNRLVQENTAARHLLGADLRLIRTEGWAAAAVLFNTKLTSPEKTIENAWARAMETRQPVRFHIYRAGERIPCWVSALNATTDTYTMITIETPDWSGIADIIERYLAEVREVIGASRGHAELITQSANRIKPTEKPENWGRRVTGFTHVIDIHMLRLYALTDLVERLERIRTGKTRELIGQTTKRIVLADFMEDFIEAIDETPLADPETNATDIRQRIRTVIPQKISVAASPAYVTQILRDVLRNAIMYSMRGSPVKIAAYANRDNTIQIDIIDEGYGIRGSDSERVFLPFTRSRQPQIMGEFGYGLSLYLCKNEVETMNGRIWFESEEGVGTTFSLKLPAWRENTSPFSSSRG